MEIHYLDNAATTKVLPEAAQAALACMTEEFLRAFAFHAGITAHVKVPYGANTHHMTEAVFKALAHALCAATRSTGNGVLSTKGSL